ncbi:GNAT family N-acetyltransferase [Fusibacter tunisiensis]|uniref:GNAT superfamily N-acetyltransferase n=1 Tax=Fusibacter tunisiensis TaxID=1008308 RepID=A0ABS2MT08_9FIRM|nr:GNAT family N-acetyltransferase [Fusibacter tunisiensis]MBM7562554.1 GNAT superfamily N-acetyltransferase [Fusibacter tunisiensis]
MWSALLEKALEDPARNYFICQTVIKGASAYDDVVTLCGGTVTLLKRKSGTIQLLISDRKPDLGVYFEIVQFLRTLSWTQVIVTRDHMLGLTACGIDARVKPGSYLAACSPVNWKCHPVKHVASNMVASDLEAVIQLYQGVFRGFSPIEYMREKIKSGRGRGMIVRKNGRLCSVAQSDFETQDFALIVGVASAEDLRKRGYGEAAFKALGEGLIQEGKTLHLIYENDIAGALYAKYGFEVYDQNYHLERN